MCKSGMIGVIIVVLLGVSCNNTGSYMPLAVGNWWEYSYSVELVGLPASVLGGTPTSGQQYDEITQVIESNGNGTLYRHEQNSDFTNIILVQYLSNTGSMYRVYKSSESQVHEVRIDDVIQAGHRWTSSSNQYDGNLTYEVISVDSIVLGYSCIHIRSEVQTSYSDQRLWTVINDEWYSLGVGLVKSISTTYPDDANASITIVYVLTDWYGN